MNHKSVLLFAVGLIISLGIVFTISSEKVIAAEAMITFSANESTVKVGDNINIGINIRAVDNIGVIDAYIDYDSSKMQFISSEEQTVSGGDGLIHIASDVTSREKQVVYYNLVFKAIASGSCSVGIEARKSVKNTSGSEMTITSNRASVKIDGSTSSSTYYESNTSSSLSGDNDLVALSVSAGDLKPSFNKDTTNYSIDVDNDVDKLYFSFKTSEKNAIVRLEGNEMLFAGKNKVKVIVTAQNGEEKVYKINVYRESLAEKNKKIADEGKKGLGFSVYEENGMVYIQNKYKLAVVDVDESDEVPAGFRKTSVLLYGTNITAYTVAKDLDSDFLLMYCMNENGDKDFYQFDRTEKTLQRYTGDMIERINANKAGALSDEIITSEQYRANLNQLAMVIAVLVGACVMLIIAIISILLKREKTKSGKIEDELDF